MLATQFTFSVESIIDRLKERQVSMFFFKKSRKERRQETDCACDELYLTDSLLTGSTH